MLSPILIFNYQFDSTHTWQYVKCILLSQKADYGSGTAWSSNTVSRSPSAPINTLLMTRLDERKPIKLLSRALLDIRNYIDEKLNISVHAPDTVNGDIPHTDQNH